MKWYVSLASLVGLCVLLGRWDTSLNSAHSFRETQTALSAYWMLHGGPWINYLTPVFGPPWRAPFEFPLYQWLSAALSACGLPLDFAGRTVSWGFFVASLWPLRRISRYWEIDPDYTSILWLCSPLMLYWGTCFLIDTTAIFFGGMFLCLMLQGRRVLSVVAGSISALVKGIAFVPFAIAGMSPLALPPLMAGLIWQKWTDLQKTGLAQVVASSQASQTLHNYGNLADRLNLPLLLRDRGSSLLGIGWIPLMVLILVIGRRRSLRGRWPLLLAFFGTLLIFPRLFTAHEYYWMALAPVATLIVGSLLDYPVSKKTAWAVVGALVVSQAITFCTVYLPILRVDQGMRPFAEVIKNNTKPDDVLLIYGMQWDPVVPYYAERKAIMEPDSLTTIPDMVFRSWTYHPAVVVRCPSQFDGDWRYEQMFTKWKVPNNHCSVTYVRREDEGSNR